MAGVKVKVEWLPKGCEQLFKYDSGVAELLLEAGERLAEKNNAAATARLHSPMRTPPYKAELRRLDHTQVCVVHSTTKAAAAIGRKYGLPKK